MYGDKHHKCTMAFYCQEISSKKKEAFKKRVFLKKRVSLKKECH